MARSIEKDRALLKFVNTPAGMIWLKLAKGARYTCIAFWVLFPIALLVIYFVEGPPTKGRVAIIVALYLVSIAVYIRLTNDLRVIASSKDYFMTEAADTESGVTSKHDLDYIEKLLKTIKPKAFYWLLATAFGVVAILFILKGIYEEKEILLPVGVIFLVVGAAILGTGLLAHTFKRVIESLLNELKKHTPE